MKFSGMQDLPDIGSDWNWGRMLSSMGTVTLLDVWKLHFDADADETTWVRRARVVTAFWEIFSLGAALFVLKFGTMITTGIKLGSIISGALLGMFLLGAFARRAVAAGAVAGAVSGLTAVCLVMALTHVSWSWYCGIGTTVTVTAGYAASLCFPAQSPTSAMRFEAAAKRDSYWKKWHATVSLAPLLRPVWEWLEVT